MNSFPIVANPDSALKAQEIGGVFSYDLIKPQVEGTGIKRSIGRADHDHRGIFVEQG